MASELTYKALQRAVANLETKVTRNADQIQGSAKVIDEEASEARREADAMAAKSVDKDSVADASELSKVIKGISDGILSYAAKGKDTARQAKAVADQARTSHGAFQEAFDRSGVDGLENVSRDWFEQS
jgi:Cft2 family RNA processing exonuclease